jgi:hypothetical protein
LIDFKVLLAMIPSALMLAALTEQDLLCRVFGDCLAGVTRSISRQTR